MIDFELRDGLVGKWMHTSFDCDHLSLLEILSAGGAEMDEGRGLDLSSEVMKVLKRRSLAGDHKKSIGKGCRFCDGLFQEGYDLGVIQSS